LRTGASEDILIARLWDGPQGLSRCHQFAAFPETHSPKPAWSTSCRHSLNFCGWKDPLKNVAKDLKRIYQATDDTEAEKALPDLRPNGSKKDRSNRSKLATRVAKEVIPSFAFPPAVRPKSSIPHQICDFERPEPRHSEKPPKPRG